MTVMENGGHRTIRISERDWSQQVYDLARLYGWLVARYPTWRPTGTAPGFPDLTLARGFRIAFVELKAEGGKLTAAQEGWRDALASVAGVEWYCWKPSQIEEVVRLLA